MNKISCRINFKAFFAMEIIVINFIILILGSPSSVQQDLLIASITFSLCYLAMACLERSSLTTEPEKFFLELGNALKKGTHEDPEHKPPASDAEISIIMSQLEDAECSDESNDENQAKEFIGKAHELLKSYRPWHTKN